MILGLDPIASGLAIAEVANPGAPNPLVQAWLADRGRVFLYELTCYLLGTASSWIVPLGIYPPGMIPVEAAVTGESVFRYSDVGYISKPTDALANTPFDPSIETGLRMTRTTPATPESDRRVRLDLGSFAITNVDGELDLLVRGYTVDGRKVRVLLGLTNYGYANFTPIFTGRIIQWSNSTTAVPVLVRDEGYRLDKLMQTDLYDGSGGYNGGSDIAGKPRPMTFGKCRNVSPLLIDSANLVFQFHHRETQAVDAVYDRGAALTADLDYASYAALVAASITTGHFATCLAKGLIRLGSTPSGLVTADLRGDAHGGYVDTTSLIAKRVVKDFGGLADSELDLSTWSNLDAAIPGTIGWFRGTDALNVSDALNGVLGHCGAWWGARGDGLIQVGRLVAPSIDAIILSIDEVEIIDFAILPPLSGTFPPRFRQRVAYQKLWTTQQETDLAGSVTAARRQYLAQDVRIASTTDATVLTNFLQALDPDPLQSLFENQSDALTLSAVLLALYKVARQTVQITVDLKGLSAFLGAAILVTHRRLNKGQPTAMLVMDVTIRADDRQVDLVLWG
jgi:hypothetical protein